MRDSPCRPTASSRPFLGFLCLLAALWGARAASPVVIPAVLAAFVALLVRPLYRRWCGDRAEGRYAGAAFAAVLVAFLACAALVGLVALAALPAMDEAPRYAEEIQERWTSVVSWAKSRNVPLPSEAERGAAAKEQLYRIGTAVVGSLWKIVGGGIVVYFLAVMILLEIPLWACSAAHAWSETKKRKLESALGSIGDQLRIYFGFHAALAACAGVAEAVFLWASGVPFAPLWGLLAFFFSFVPNFGAFIASVPPVLLAGLTGGWEWALFTAVGLTAIEVLLGNVVAPLVEGERMIVSPLVILFAVVFWTWHWGAAGAFLGAPLTAAIVIAMAHIEAVRPFALMLSLPTRTAELVADAQGEAAPS